MAVPLTIAGTTFQYPEAGTDPQWGQNATDWAVAVTEAINTLLSPGDILQTEFTINNNQAVATNINGLLFDSGTVRAANITYSIYRTSNANPSGNVENGTIYINYDDSAPNGTKWKMSQIKNGDAGVTISVGDSGQFQYTSDDIDSTGYTGVMQFSAKSLPK